MKLKFKKMSMFIFAALFVNDLCQYIKAFRKIDRIELKYFSLFFAQVEESIFVYHISMIYLVSLMTIYFFTHFFRHEPKYFYE